MHGWLLSARTPASRRLAQTRPHTLQHPPRAPGHRPREPGRGPKYPKGTWHDLGVTDQEARYDRIAEGYAAWWSPVHRPATLGLLDEVAATSHAGARRLLDVGLRHRGHGSGRRRRWPTWRSTASTRRPACSRSRGARRRRSVPGRPRGCRCARRWPTGCRSRTRPSTSPCPRSYSSWCRRGSGRCARCGACSGRAAGWRT